MRLVRQYREDRVQLAGRLLLLGFFLVAIYVLTTTCARVFSQSFADADNMRQDQALLQNVNLSDQNSSVDERIAKREGLLAKVQGKDTAARLRAEVAQLYDQKGNGCLNQGDLATAEFCFKRATELDPSNPNYYSETAQLYADDAVRQKTAGNQMELYRNSVVYYSQAIERAHNTQQKQQISNSAASASYDLAKLEYGTSSSKSLAVQDLQKAKEWVTPGTQAASDIEQLFLLADN